MICPRPNTHDPNPAAVPIKEAIKETFRVFMARPRLLDTTESPVWFRPDSRISPANRACSSAEKGCYLNVEPICTNNRNYLGRSIFGGSAVVDEIPICAAFFTCTTAGYLGTCSGLLHPCDGWRTIAISLIDPVVSVIACFRHLLETVPAGAVSIPLE